jgi:hypothetical protein
METALEYMEIKHPTLTKLHRISNGDILGYRTPDGDYYESCDHIAKEIARRLLNEGKLPWIIEIHGKFDDEYNRKLITPKPFGDILGWGNHKICCESGWAYDPMVGIGPVAIDRYREIAFEGDVEMEILIEQDRIREFIDRRKEPICRSSDLRTLQELLL